jgi:glycosyltransferase involved in cell wall biosynthesis
MVEAFVHGWLDTYALNVDRVIAPSQFFLEKYVEWGWPREKLIYIPNYADSEVLIPNFEPGPYFLYFGRLSIEKGLRTLIHAASAAKIALKIAGTGPEEALLRSMATSLGLDIEFLGYRSGEDLHNLIRSAKTVILPSECFENAPLSVLESYAHGKPVVGARIGGIPELILENETGWTFTSGSVDDLARVLERANRSNPAELTAMGKAGREFVRSRFSKSQYLESVLSVYSQLGVAL